MEEAADIPPPLWPQTPTRRHVRRTSSVFLNSDALIMLLLVISLCFIFLVIIPPFHHFTRQFFRSHSVKKNWDFLSLVLVLFAIACGFLSRNKDENMVNHEVHRTLNASERDQMSNPSTLHQWHEHSDRRDLNLLCQPSEVATNEHWGFSGGPYITNYPFPNTDPFQHCRNLKEFEEELDIKGAATGAFPVYQEVPNSSVPQFSFPPLLPSEPCPRSMRPPTPPTVVERKVERINEAVGQCEDGDKTFELPSPSAPQPLDFQASEDKINKNKKKRAADSKEFSSSLKRRKKKKKKQRPKNVENFNVLLGPQHHYLTLCLPWSRMPPPSVFHHLTTTDLGKTRKDCLVPQQPSSPASVTSEPSASKTDIQNGSFNFQRTVSPPRNPKVNSSVRDPPLLPLPPPVTTPELQIVMHGDYFGTKSETRSANPKVREDFKSKKASPWINASPPADEKGETKGSMICSSPDVDRKADSFIERFRAGLKLERMNSIKERQRRTSTLGRKQNPGPEQYSPS